MSFYIHVIITFTCSQVLSLVKSPTRDCLLTKTMWVKGGLLTRLYMCHATMTARKQTRSHKSVLTKEACGR